MPIYNPADAKAKVWPSKDYDAELVGCRESISKGEKTKGQVIEEVIFKVYDADGNTKQVSDRIIYPDPENPDSSHSLWKLKAIARAIGKESEFEAGTFQVSEQRGESLRVELGIERQAGYEDKNVIARIIVPKGKGNAGGGRMAAAAPAAVKEEEIPF